MHPGRLVTFGLLVGWLAGIAGAETPRTNPRAVAEVLAGRRAEADPAWWGFDPVDATPALQAAIDSGARRVRLRRQASPWVVRPIQLRSHLELVFDPGVVVLAKAGEFRGRGDSLFTGTDLENVTLRGHDAILRMRKDDYQKLPYEKAEWRMGVAFRGCRNIRVEGLRIESSGGDGLYVGSSPRHRWCENVVIRRCESLDNHRQGLSVISAVHLRVEDCLFAGTSGTVPEAGIDFEPDEADERLVDCMVRRCRFVNNQGSGLLVYLKPLTSRSAPVSIRVEDCEARMEGPGGGSGLTVGWVRDDGPRGQVEFIRCTTRRTGREGARVVDKAAGPLGVVFRQCRFLEPWRADHPEPSGPRAAILVHQDDPAFCRHPGGLHFDRCRVEDSRGRPAFWYRHDHALDPAPLREVTGRLLHVVHSPSLPPESSPGAPIALEIQTRVRAPRPGNPAGRPR